MNNSTGVKPVVGEQCVRDHQGSRLLITAAEAVQLAASSVIVRGDKGFWCVQPPLDIEGLDQRLKRARQTLDWREDPASPQYRAVMDLEQQRDRIRTGAAL